MDKCLVLFCIASLSLGNAFADSWFDAQIGTYDSWPSDGSDKVVSGQGTWTGTENALYADAKLYVDPATNDGSLVFDPAVHKTPATAQLTYSFSTRFTPMEGFPAIVPGTRCGVSVYVDDFGATNYCGLAKNPDPEGDGCVWVTLSGVAPNCDAEVALKIAIKKEGVRSYAQYRVGETALAYNDQTWIEICDTSDMTGAVMLKGRGEISALSATDDSAEPAVMKTLTIPALDNYSIASVKVAGVDVLPDGNGNYVVEQGSVVTVVFEPAMGWAIDVASMTFVVNDDMTLPETGRPTPVNVAATVTINEVMAKNGVTLRTKRGFEGLDWVELYNSGDSDVDLTGWYMGNDPTKKTTKWTPIEGSCIVPSKGYKIVWFDGDGLCENWASDEAHVAANISTDVGKHTVFLASAADTEAIVQQIKMPGGVKDISYGRGHLSRTLVSSTSAAEYKVGSGSWKQVDGPVGMSAVAGGFQVVSYKINKEVSNMDVADACLLDPSTWSAGYPVTNNVQTLAFAGSGTTCDFDTSLYQGFPGATGDDIIYVATGTVSIPESGDWTFAVGSDDGFSAKLTRLGRTWGWESRGTRGYGQSTATFNLTAGAYEVEVRYFNRGGGFALDFSASKGRKGFSASEFQLVGLGDVVHSGALGAQVAADVSSEMVGISKTLDWKTSFTLDDAPNSADVFRLLVKYADGFTAKVNGKTVASVAATSARLPANALQPQTFLVDAADFSEGLNTLEITAENNAINDTEFYLSAELVHDMADDMFVYFQTPTPGAANSGSGRTGFTPKVAFSETHGWKESAFDLALSCPDNATAVIYYTLDGTSPMIGSASTFRYVAPIHVDRTTVVRAAVPDVDSILQIDASATYLFYDDVISQDSSVPAGFPADQAVNSQWMRYGFDPAITQGDADTRARLKRGLTENTRTISLVIDPKNLFDGAIGIYVNATGNGRIWERQTMAEQINPMDPTDEFSISAGLRIRGAFSRGSNHPKHSFRLFFRSEYGMGTLEHPLFGDEGTDEFEKIDFRTSQNYSWANNENGDTFIHECFSRDSEGAMGSTYNRSRYYNLFINGVYWGLYQTEERVDQNYAESYNGGAAENYDVIRTSQPGYNTGVVEGESAAWTELWRITTQEGYGAGHEANYNKVRGLNPDGTRNPEYPVLVNVTNLIVHTLTAHFAEDSDSPVTGGGMPNNILAFRNRKDGEGKEDGFMWNRHDAEHSMGFGGGYNSLGSLIYGTSEKTDTGRDYRAFENFNPNLLSYELTANADYRQVFGDLVYKYMVKEGGALTAPVAEARYRARMAEIDDVIVCESARWGYQYPTKRTRKGWLNSCNDRITFIQNRLQYLIPEYRRRGWYPSVDVPGAVNGIGASVSDGTTFASNDRLFFTSDSGTVYYTLDGSDPRSEGGAVATGAVAFSGASPAPAYVPVISKGDVWKYSEDGAKPAADWMDDAYNDSSWKTGASRLGFGSGTFATALSRYVGGGSSGTQVTTYYFRKTFTMPADADQMTSLKAALDCDDGYVAYINGVEVGRDQVTSTEYSAFSTAVNLGEKDAMFTFPAGTLVEGENVIAVEVHQCNATSSDVWWDLELSYATLGTVDGGIEVPVEGLSLSARVLSASGEWSPLETFAVKGEMPQGDVKAGLRLAEALTSAPKADGDEADYLVVTNVVDGEISLEGVRIVAWNSKKSESDASLTYVFGTGASLLPGASLKIAATSFPAGGKLTNGALYLRIYAADDSLIQEVYLDAGWWNSACDGTGEHFIAKTFGAEAKTHSDWMPTATTIGDKLRVLELYTSTSDGGDTGEYVVLTNLDASAKLDLADVKIVAWNSKKKSEADPSLVITLGDISIPKGGTITLDQATYFGSYKLTNSKVGLKAYDPAGACAQEVEVDADWWNGACDGTGASFLALEFGPVVKNESQWMAKTNGWTDWPDDPDTEITDETTPADLSITGGAFTTSTTAELRKLSKWAKANGVAFGGEAVQTMAFDAEGNPLTLAATAYLLNCAPTSEDVATAKAAFRFTEIVPGVTPTIDGSGYNGTITVYGADKLGDEWSEISATTRFYRAKLTR